MILKQNFTISFTRYYLNRAESNGIISNLVRNTPVDILIVISLSNIRTRSCNYLVVRFHIFIILHFILFLSLKHYLSKDGIPVSAIAICIGLDLLVFELFPCHPESPQTHLLSVCFFIPDSNLISPDS